MEQQGAQTLLPVLRFDFNSLANMESMNPPLSVQEVAEVADDLPFRVLRALVFVAKGVATPTLDSAGDWIQARATETSLVQVRSHVLAAFIESFPKATGAKAKPTTTPEAPEDLTSTS